ncbi:hypothetical protein B9Z65_8518 [Elsinoe australis]|uniref:Uncharacterized protein n=1 Tax=Elsinoe australis TaxID=40998 RepID=A0A2P7YDY1_9PEZI|nr:hypothetical protein B9Z65_8518 [Elsinoe australis]
MAPDLNLLFNAHETGTIASIHGSNPAHPEEGHSFDVHIQSDSLHDIIMPLLTEDSRDGDLRAPTNYQNLLHNFSLQRTPNQSPQGIFRLPFNMNLGVGGDGVIGRRIQLVHRGLNGESIIRQGIIGWN